jgi:hypothetical protein
MRREISIVLDGETYRVPALNIGQLQEVGQILSSASNGAATSGSFEVLKVALRRVDPKPDLETLCPTYDEVGAAVRSILAMSGLQKPDENPPQPQPETQTPSP